MKNKNLYNESDRNYCILSAIAAVCLPGGFFAAVIKLWSAVGAAGIILLWLIATACLDIAFSRNNREES
jgi:hypothetical protein